MENSQSKSPTYPPPSPPALAPALERNIEALYRRREGEEASAGLETRLAEAITRFTGSMLFVYIHAALFSAWILMNSGMIPGLPAFDPSFVILAMVASVEAIFLSTFVLISQNRNSAIQERRAELDLQVSLLTEHEITELASLLSAIGKHLGVVAASAPAVEEAKRDIAPDVVLDRIETIQSEP